MPLDAVLNVNPFGERTGPGTGAAMLVLVAFVLSFVAIRTSARLTRSVSWWPGSVHAGGVHVHHLVWGVCLMMLAGFLSFAVPPQAPWWHITAVVFGIGAGFTLDEFALWVHLEDVYWAKEGRKSFDAFVIALAFAALVVLGTIPFGLNDPASISVTATTVFLVLSLATIAFLKGRILLGLIGLFIPLVALYGAVRLGHPESPWGRRRYRGSRLARSRSRFAEDAPAMRLRRRISDFVAGAPHA